MVGPTSARLQALGWLLPGRGRLLEEGPFHQLVSVSARTMLHA